MRGKIMNYGIDTTQPAQLTPNIPGVLKSDGYVHAVSAHHYVYDNEFEVAGTLYVWIGCSTLIKDTVRTGENHWDAIKRVVATWKREQCEADHAEALEINAPAPFNLLAPTDDEMAVLETNMGGAEATKRGALEAAFISTEHAARYFRPESLTLRADIDPAAYSSAIRNADDTAREEGFIRLTPPWFKCLDWSYEMMRVENETARERAEFYAAQDAEAEAEAIEPRMEIGPRANVENYRVTPSVEIGSRYDVESYRLRGCDHVRSHSRKINGKTYDFSLTTWADGSKTVRVWEGGTTNVLHRWHG
jgi:hypothetical protein